jgi:lysophospholipase L1-like esterase
LIFMGELVRVASLDVEEEREALVASPSRYHTATFEIDNLNEDDDTSCWCDMWRMIASSILTACLLGPLVFSQIRKYHTFDSPSTEFWPVADLNCTSSLNVDFTALYGVMQGSIYFCDDSETRPEHCACNSPLKPLARIPNAPGFWEKWDATFERNKELAAGTSSPDVVMVGDSITEHWVGTDLGEVTHEAMSVHRVFTKLFEQGDVRGLALGLAGDRCPQLLYRLKWGEMPESLQPKVWWLLIGTNDLSDHCSQEAILIGTIEIVMEIRRKRPDATIVVNGILPRPGNPLGVLNAGKQLWKKIENINDRMKCFTEGMRGVEFFNATDLFLTSDGIVDVTTMFDLLHPNGKGADIWGRAILQKVKEILSQ